MLALRDEYFRLVGEKKYAPEDKLPEIQERMKVIEAKFAENKKFSEEQQLNIVKLQQTLITSFDSVDKLSNDMEQIDENFDKKIIVQ